MATEAKTPLKVLMFPWLAYGHISPFLELAKQLAHRNLSIYLCSTPINLDSIKNKIHPKYSSSISLVELHLPDLPELPPPYHTTNGLPPHLMSTLKKATHMAKPDLSDIVTNLSPHIIIYDINVSWVAALASRHNIPAVRFSTSSAVMLAYFCHMNMKPGIPFPFSSICLTEFEQAQARVNIESARRDIEKEDPEDKLPMRFCESIAIIKTSPEFDAECLNYLSDLFRWKLFPVCVSLHEVEDMDSADHELIHWLESKTEHSSVFISFGSEYFLKEEEIREIAFGLELINEVNFIWALRFPKEEGCKRKKIEQILPDGFLDRVKNRGRIVEGWAPQSVILRHSSIGGFVSHCGWNSILESIEIGVPIIAMPMHLDQPLNARLVVETGVAVEVMRDENGAFKREKIAKAIGDVMMGEKGGNMREKMRGLGAKMKAREKEDLDAVAEMLSQLSIKNGGTQ